MPNLVFVQRSVFTPPPPEGPASMVFDGSAEELVRTWSTSSPDTTKATLSFWAKAASLADMAIMASILADESDLILLQFDYEAGDPDTYAFSAATFSAFSEESEDLAEAGMTAWHHYVVRYDSTLGTAADRLRLYRNGSLLSAASSTAPGASASHLMFDDGGQMNVGSGFGFFEGKLAFVDVLEGVSAAPDDFAFDDGGTWTRKPYTGSYGNYGFSLTGVGGIGNDVSGNDQDFTPNNMTNNNLDTEDLPPWT